MDKDMLRTRTAGAAILGLVLTFGTPALSGNPQGAPGHHPHATKLQTLVHNSRPGIRRAGETSGGQNNSVRVVQTGDGNRSLIRQIGNDHSANLEQHGGGNGQVIIQMGNGASANVTQTGNQSGVLLQFGR